MKCTSFIQLVKKRPSSQLRSTAESAIVASDHILITSSSENTVDRLAANSISIFYMYFREFPKDAEVMLIIALTCRILVERPGAPQAPDQNG
jgi:hypothetical protein